MGNTQKFNDLLEFMNAGGMRQVVFDLTSVDGNAFSLMGAWQKAARRSQWSADDIKTVLDECMSGDYDHLVQTLISVTE